MHAHKHAPLSDAGDIVSAIIAGTVGYVSHVHRRLYISRNDTAMFSKLDEFINGIDAYVTDECRICLCS